MSDSNKAKAVRGKPFVKGDSRINRDHGPLCKEAASFQMNLKNAVAKRTSFNKLAKVLMDAAERGKPWAWDKLYELFVDKAKQPVDLSGEITLHAIWNGNGNEHKTV